MQDLDTSSRDSAVSRPMKRFLMAVITSRMRGYEHPGEADPLAQGGGISKTTRGEATSEEVKKPWHVTPETGRVNSLK